MKRVAAVILAASVTGCLTSADYATENGTTRPTISGNDAAKLVALVRDQLKRCWAPPVGTDVPPVMVHLQLNQDGSLAGEPVVLPVNSQNAQSQPAAQSALRAVRACAPLKLPAALYGLWKDMVVNFDPRDMRSSPDDARR
jgi:colicin import membrane protein